ncbi:N-6 DNA methylase [Edwardsiella anguillarum]|nr:N-6 DNA methylase [Edwardsiella anguillarum]
MSAQLAALRAKAISLIEQSRYRMGTNRFIEAFIDNWAYLQTRLYPPQEVIPDELNSVAIELSHTLSSTMKLYPTNDALGYILSMFGLHHKGTSYFPTPPEVGLLLSQLVNNRDGNDFYEPCCGSGINTIQWMENRIKESGTEAIRHLSINLEDIDPLMIKSCLIQLLHYFESRDVTPRSLSIVCINTISRQTKGVSYYAEQPPHTLSHCI